MYIQPCCTVHPQSAYDGDGEMTPYRQYHLGKQLFRILEGFGAAQHVLAKCLPATTRQITYPWATTRIRGCTINVPTSVHLFFQFLCLCKQPLEKNPRRFRSSIVTNAQLPII
ncbi:hypothetical protein PS2_043851 [Malus domestica]